MREVTTLRNQLERIKQRIPKDQHYAIFFSFGSGSEAHGFLGGRIFHLVINRGKENNYIEAVKEADELTQARKTTIFYTV
mgnify:CR=1 FL=1